VPQASDIFLFAASISVVFLTIFAAFVTYAVVKAAQEVRKTASLIHRETERIVLWRSRITKSISFAGHWLTFMAKRFTRNE
jgi:hypothetical protein